MRKYFFLLCALLAMQAAQGQIAFGPYLTYGGKSTDTVGQMTVQFGVQANDTRTYYVVYWNKDSTKVYCKTLTATKTFSSKGSQYPSSAVEKYKIWTITLKGLAQGGVYRYFVSEYFDYSLNQRFSSFRFTGKSNITNADLAANSPLVLVKSAELSGTVSGTDREVVLIGGESKLGIQSFTFPTSNNLKISTLDKQRVYTFIVPKDNDTILKCIVISDTQDVAGGNQLFPALSDTIKHGLNASFILHGGDFQDFNQTTTPFISNYNELTSLYKNVNNSFLFGSIPIQVTEGNHDMGYAYGKSSLTSNESQITTTNGKYTTAQIWFDKLFQYNYPTLNKDITIKAVDGKKDSTTTDHYSHYYSFDWGSVHVSVLDFNLSDTHDGQYNPHEQEYTEKELRWLVDDLDSATAKGKRWKIILSHYTSDFNLNSAISINPFTYKNITSPSTSPIDALDSIIFNRGVDIVIDGHQHIGSSPTDGSMDEFKVALRKQYPTKDSVKWKNRHLRMRIPVDASNSDAINGGFSYFTLSFNGNILKVEQFYGWSLREYRNKPFKPARTFYLNRIHNITEK